MTVLTLKKFHTNFHIFEKLPWKKIQNISRKFLHLIETAGKTNIENYAKSKKILSLLKNHSQMKWDLLNQIY